MKWFKHVTNASRDDKIVSLHAHFGWEGVGRWWYIVEQVAEQYKKNGEPSGTFHFGKLALSLEVRREKLRSYLEVMSKLSLIFYTITDELLIISIPKLQKLKDNYTSDLEHTSKPLPSKEIEIEIEIEKEIKKEKINKKKTPRDRGELLSFGSEFGNVKLSQVEYDKLKEKHGEIVLLDIIEKVDGKIESGVGTIPKWKNHYIGIRDWDVSKFGGSSRQSQAERIKQLQEELANGQD